jgi:ankyrin repeat protein
MGMAVSMLGRVAAVGYTLLPTVVDAGIALGVVAVAFKKIDTQEKLRWLAGGSSLAGVVTWVVLRGNTAMYKTIGALVYVAWKACEVYLYYAAVANEKSNVEWMRQNALEKIKDGKYSLADLDKYVEEIPHFFDAKNDQGKNILHIAAENGRDVFITWLSSKAELFSKLNVDLKGWKPLHLAICYGKVECAKLLSKSDPQKLLNEEVPLVGNARSIALRYDQLEIVKWLERAELLRRKDETVDQFFEKALDAKAMKVMGWLYTQLTTEDQTKGARDKVLKFALQHGHIPIANWVHGQNSALNSVILNDFTLLSEVVQKGHQKTLEWVHEKLPTTIQQKNQSGTNLMYVAIVHNRLDTAKWLYKQDSQLFREAIKKDLSEVSQKESYQDMANWVQEMTGAVADAENRATTTKNQAVAAFFALIENYNEKNAEKIAKYLDSNRDFFDRSHNDENILHIAARKGHSKLIGWMRFSGLFSKLNVANGSGWKPLHMAAKHGNLACVEELSKQDLAVLQENLPNIGDVRSIAFAEGKVDIIAWLDKNNQLLKEGEKDEDLFDEALKTKINNALALSWLYTEKLKDGQREHALEKALIAAVGQGNLAIAEWVLTLNSEALQTVKKDGKNMMYVAICHGQTAIAQWLDDKDKTLFEALRGLDFSGIIDHQKYNKMANWVTKRALS